MVKELTYDNFKSETADGVCVLDFWASWCGPCRMMSPVIDGLAEKRPDIKFFKVNVDEEDRLAAAFRVESIPMIVVMRDGKVAGGTVGYMPEETLVRELGI
ncbi:MAG TPA: thioredoxin [Firmicutes bacterium]|nr:thioredoxin [Bacillota bacterium]